MYEQLGRLIKHRRKDYGLSRIALASKAGVGKTVVFDIEQGKSTVRFNVLIQVLAALDIDLQFCTDSMRVKYKLADLVGVSA